MKQAQQILIDNYLKIIFSILFALLVLAFYFYTHPEYLQIAESPPRFQIFLILFLVYAIPVAVNKILQAKLQNFSLPVLFPMVLTFFAGLYVPQYFLLKEIGYLENADFLFYTRLTTSVFGGTLWIVFISWLTGAMVELGNKSAHRPFIKKIVLQTGKGIMVITLVLFLLGKFNVLNPLSLWLYSGFIVILGVAFRKKILNAISFQPSKITDFSIWGHLLIFGIITILAFNFMEQLRPVPSGYDGMTVYANLSFLLADYQKLVPGFGAYNWSLFASIGMILFRKPEMILMANFQIVVLSLITFYWLLKSQIGKTPALLGVLLLAVLPSLNRMVYMQQKVEGAFLFFTLILLIQVFQLLKNPNQLSIVIQIGLTAGFLFGIKLTSILLIIPIIIGIWYINIGLWGLLAATCGAFLVLMNANLDFFSGLSMWNRPSSTYLWILTFGLISSLVTLIIKNKNALWLSIKQTAIIIAMLLIAFAPWAYKNSQEIDQLSFTGIFQGRSSIHLIQ